MNNLPLKYSHFNVVFQEVPNETTLAIDITGCPHGCPGCHSQFLSEYFGNNMLNNANNDFSKEIVDELAKLNGMITCICMMGGDQNMDQLVSALAVAKNKYNLKTCVYSGIEKIDLNFWARAIPLLDYLKIGNYIEALGGLKSKKTNQTFFSINGDKLIDITHEFQKEYK